MQELITDPMTFPVPNVAFKTALLKLFREFFRAQVICLLAWPYNKPFSGPNLNISVCLASLCMGPKNLHQQRDEVLKISREHPSLLLYLCLEAPQCWGANFKMG